MSRVKFRYILLIGYYLISSCNQNRNGGGTGAVPPPNIGVPGGAAIFGSVFIGPECGAPVASVMINIPNSAQMLYNVQVPSGGSFNFQTSPGMYMIVARAGNCAIGTNIQTIPAGATPYRICLGVSCTGGPMPYTMTMLNAMKTKSELCTWDVYGCQGSYYPGAGTINMVQNHMLFYSKKEMALHLDLEFFNGNNILSSVPNLPAKGWDLKIREDGKIESPSENDTYLISEFMRYQVQADEKLFQWTQRICAPKNEILSEMSRYLAENNFNPRTIKDFEVQTKEVLPASIDGRMCFYPQSSKEIDRIMNYKTSTQITSYRIWFIVVPELHEAVLKIRPFPTQTVQMWSSAKSLKSSDKKEMLSSSKESEKKNVRKVANESALVSEEWGVGFLLAK